jgi:hypothetical protein
MLSFFARITLGLAAGAVPIAASTLARQTISVKNVRYSGLDRAMGVSIRAAIEYIATSIRRNRKKF